jgi:ubiquinone/menaquinone biosynthesis C-methylase UbiE
MPKEISRLTTRQNYDRLSRWYDSFSAGERRLAQTGLHLLAIRLGDKVLEIGSGTGHALIALAHLVGRNGHVEGVDLSPGMVAVASRRIQKAGLADRVSLQTADATCLPFPEGQFQCVFLSFTLELFKASDIPVVLAECWRVLSPGGQLGVVSLEKIDIPIVKVYEWFHKRFPKVVDCRPIFLREVLEEAGFEVLQITENRLWGLPVASIVGRRP